MYLVEALGVVGLACEAGPFWVADHAMPSSADDLKRVKTHQVSRIDVVTKTGPT